MSDMDENVPEISDTPPGPQSETINPLLSADHVAKVCAYILHII